MIILCVWSGPAAKKMKKGEFKPKKGLTKEELTQNRQQKKKELKKTRQLAERKDMFQIICQAKQVWGDLRRYTHTHTHSHTVGLLYAFLKKCFLFIKNKTLWNYISIIHHGISPTKSCCFHIDK